MHNIHKEVIDEVDSVKLIFFLLSLCFSNAATPKPLPPEKTPNSVTSPMQDGAGDFQLGERVWVNGNKPGVVQFVGGTQFAPGQWAGIVLDEAIGKNDGSVAGVRYFQCEDGRGIFTRASKLSRTVLPEKEANGGQGSPAPDASALANAAPAAGAATTGNSYSDSGIILANEVGRRSGCSSVAWLNVRSM